ncbi:hypothetical protein [Flavobacterium columnare]|uniref:hypothetical protein n=1 Tax=Flavobacterium columnare TaxID=996 RepID=UPI0015E2BC7D|nr:hypothetical protein [Flavobacterium columnare]
MRSIQQNLVSVAELVEAPSPNIHHPSKRNKTMGTQNQISIEIPQTTIDEVLLKI